MPELTVPKSTIQSAGRVAQVRVDNGQMGSVVAQFGENLTVFAEHIQAQDDKYEMDRARVDLTRDLGQLHQQYKNNADPAAIDAGWAGGVKELRESYLTKVSDKNRERVGLAFDDLSSRYGLSLGQRSIDLRADRGRAVLGDYTEQVFTSAATADDETRAELMGNLSNAFADAVGNGLMSEEDAAIKMRAIGENLDRARANQMLGEDPAKLVEQLKAGIFPHMDPLVRSKVVVGAKAAVARLLAIQTKEGIRLAKERNVEIGNHLDTIIHNAGEGRFTDHENDVMVDPSVAAHPKFKEAQEAINLRNDLPGYSSMTVSEMDIEIKREDARKLVRKDETKRLGAMERIRDASAIAWTKDPYGQAEKVLGNKPAAMPEFDAKNTDDFDQFLNQRNTYAQSLHQSGYTQNTVFFRPAERAKLKTMVDVAKDPSDRLALAVSMTNALGANAPAAIAEIGGDVLFTHVGGLMSAGGDPETARMVFEGQQALVNKTVRIPNDNDKINVLYSQFENVFAGNDAAEGRLRAVADAIYASQARGIDPEAEGAKDQGFKLYSDAIHLAMGGSYDVNNKPLGGVQSVQGELTPLPMGVSAANVSYAFQKQTLALSGFMKPSRNRRALRIKVDGQRAFLSSGKSGGIPHYAGEPITPDDMADIKLRAVGNDRYQLYVERRDGFQYDLTDSTDPSKPYVFSLTEFIKEAGR